MIDLKIKNKIISSTLLCTMIAYTTPVFAFNKEETVYTKMDVEGENYQTIVSTHIENKEELEMIEDISDLLNIENTKGDETFQQEGNSLIWKAEKKDIYYQGESKKELPIDCEIKYEWNGKEVKAEEIVGKTGKVKIKIQYTNKEEHWVEINGKKEKLYTPFVVVAGTVIQNDKNKEIEITNGKVIEDGSKTVVLGIALPGLQESLKTNKINLEIPDEIEITMEATEFELGNIISFVTPKVLEEKDLTFLDSLDEIYDQVNTLEETSSKIKEGSTTLMEGTNQLNSGTKELKEGTNSAYQGAKQIKSEVEKATKQLANDKSSALDNATLNEIGEVAKKEVTKILEIQKIGEQAEAIAKQEIQSEKALIAKEAESQAVSLTKQEMASQEQEIRNMVKLQLEKNDTYNQIQDESVKKMILQFSQESALTTAKETAVKTASQVANVTATNVAEEVAKSVANRTAQNVAGKVATQVAESTATSIASQVATQVKTQAQNRVIAQMGTLGEGLDQLTNGLSNLKEGTNSLQEGSTRLKEGSDSLAKGIAEFHEKGIKKICDYLNGDVKEIQEKVEKLTELSKEYNNFTMLSGENNGSVKFIMIMDAIKQQEKGEEPKEKVVIDTKKQEDKKEAK